MPIRYHSEPSDVPYSPTQFLALDFFCCFLQQDCSNRNYLHLNMNSSDPLPDFIKHDGCLDQHCNSIYYDFKYYIDGIAVLVVAIFGIIGTLMSVVVLFQPQLRNPFTNFLTALCIFDCSFLMMAILNIALPAISCW